MKAEVSTMGRTHVREKNGVARLDRAFVLSGSDLFDVFTHVHQCSMYILACQGINVLSLVVSETLSITTSLFRSEAI